MTTSVERLRRTASFVRNTPFHPQWFAYRGEQKRIAKLRDAVRGIVLDIGCADQKPRRHLAADSAYVGLDYYATASSWYGTRPHVYGEARALPIRSQAIDAVLLLDVLEHVPNAADALSEIARVLKSGGKFVLQVPFLYPLHDAPLDFQRWTVHGLYTLAERYGFTVVESEALGRPLETAALLANLALAKSVLDAWRRHHPLALLVMVLPAFCLMSNVLAWLLTLFLPSSNFMAHGFRLVLERR